MKFPPALYAAGGNGMKRVSYDARISAEAKVPASRPETKQ